MFYEKHIDYMIEDYIEQFNEVRFQELSRKYDGDWRLICANEKLEENFIRQYHRYMHWMWVCTRQKLSESFMYEFYHKMDWYSVSSCQILSEKFISDNMHKLDKHSISHYQIMSEKFIRDNIDNLSIFWLLRNEKLNLSDNFRNKLLRK
jgi:hypothetical protein